MMVLITYDVNTEDAAGRKRLAAIAEAVRELWSASAEFRV